MRAFLVSLAAALALVGCAPPAAGGEGGGGSSSPLIESVTPQGSFSFGNQYGWEFTANQALSATGARVFMPSASVETVRLWRVSDQTLLASIEITGVAAEWVTAEFATPVSLAPASNYVVTTRESSNASRPIYYANYSLFSFNAVVSYVSGRQSASSAFPASTGSEIDGFPDLLVAPT